ncbi:hypothetical protein FS837_006419 [Tulasnella sp. UAMH 9824]|nr:hypothetical protein FS837_006419 [Tulasnella sp. UAMH 9824]
MTPAEIDVLRTDVLGYLQGLRAAHFGFAAITSLLVWDILGSFDREVHYVWRARWSYAKGIFFVNRYLPPITFICTKLAWVWLILCTLSATNVSFVLGVRLWALYERDRLVLALLGVGFLGCFVPAWTLTFKTATTSFDPDEFRTLNNVYAYSMGVVIEDGPQALNWPLTKCYRFRHPKISNSIIVASFLYDRLVRKMLKDRKKTRTIEAFYRDEGDPIIDGQFGPDDPDEGKVWDRKNSSSRVSTFVQFAHMLSGSSPNTVEIRSERLGRGTQPTLSSESASEERTIHIQGPNTGITSEATSPRPLHPHTPAQRQKLDWFDTAAPPGDPSPGVLETARNRSHDLNAGSRSTGMDKVQRLSLQLPRYPNSPSSREQSSVVMEMEEIKVARES